MIKISLIENATRLPELARQTGQRHFMIADNLSNGGTTVSKGVMAESIRYAHENKISLDVIIRPRTGTPQYTDMELNIMEADIFEAQQLGADGVVVSAITTDNTLDINGLNNFIAAASGMTVTFNHDWDILRKNAQDVALDELAVIGFDRILTANINHLTDRIKVALEKGISLVPIISSLDTTPIAQSDIIHYVVEINK